MLLAEAIENGIDFQAKKAEDLTRLLIVFEN